jgi:hypothetical protein
MFSTKVVVCIDLIVAAALLISSGFCDSRSRARALYRSNLIWLVVAMWIPFLFWWVHFAVLIVSRGLLSGSNQIMSTIILSAGAALLLAWPTFLIGALCLMASVGASYILHNNGGKGRNVVTVCSTISFVFLCLSETIEFFYMNSNPG